jgi:hypothetical protein
MYLWSNNHVEWGLFCQDASESSIISGSPLAAIFLVESQGFFSLEIYGILWAYGMPRQLQQIAIVP